MEEVGNTGSLSMATSSQPSDGKHAEAAASGFDFSEKLAATRDEVPELNPSSQSRTQGYLTGVKLFLVMFSLTLATFLMLLDSSIVATVSQGSPRW
jgi:hypothetical protein